MVLEELVHMPMSTYEHSTPALWWSAEGWEETPGGVVSLQQQGGGLPQPSQHSAQQGQELGRAETAPRTSSAEKRAQAKRAAIAACLADSEDEDCL